MKILKSKSSDNQVFDWRDDPTLAAALKQGEVLEHKVTTLDRARSKAETEVNAAHEALEDAASNALLDRATPQDVEAAEATYLKAQTAFAQHTEELAPLARALDRLRKELAPLEAEAKKAALLRLRRVYAEAGARLATILDEAEAANEELVRLYRLALDCVPSNEPWAGLPALWWQEFLFNEHAQDGGCLGHWRKRVASFLAGKPDVVEPPPGTGNTKGESEDARQARRRRADELSSGRRKNGQT